MKTVGVKHFQGETAKHMARSMKKDVERFRSTRSGVTGKYTTKPSGEGQKK